jgi:hypothetical protein
MRKYSLVLLVSAVTILLVFFIKCSAPGIPGSAQAAGTTGSSIDLSPIPANSEFLKEEPE